MKRRTVVALLPALLGAGGCAPLVPPQTAALLAAAPPDLSRRIELDDVPFFPQTPYQCGPAALATVLTHAGFAADPGALADAVFLPARAGTLQAEMLTGARRQGMLAVRLPGTLEALMHEAAEGRPSVVLLNLGLSFAPVWHYAVFIGYDLDERTAVLRSGTTRRDLFALRTFEYTWARSGHWAFAVTKPGELPRVAAESDAQQAALGFERVASPADAVLAWRSVTERWPDGLLQTMGLGNALLKAGEAAQAARAFERVAERHDSAAAWNNLAQVRLQLGDKVGARTAAERAVARARQSEPRWLDAAESTLREVR